jgi:hypothetical protein
VLDGPEWLRSVYRLSDIPEYNVLNPFFHSVLNIRNPNHHDFLDELRYAKGKGDEDLNTIKKAYRYLMQEFEIDQGQSALRFVVLFALLVVD